MIFFGLGVWQTYVVVLAISKAIRRKPYRDRVPPFSSPIWNLVCQTPPPICNRLGPYLLRQYLLRFLLLKNYSDDFQEVFYDVLLSGRHRRRLPGIDQVVFSLPGSRPSLKMDLPELPPRMFILGEDLAAIRSISYHSDDTKLFKALCDCLTADEYEDLKASKLGVFIKFKELDFGWTSRLFEHLTGPNCDYIKDLENPRCEVTKEMAAFWEKMGVDLDTGLSIEQITEAFYRCNQWSRDDRKRLGYLAIYAGYIEGKKFSTTTPDSLARLVMDLEKFENYPWGRVAFKVLMDTLKAKDLTQTGYTVDGFIQVIQNNVNNFVQKDLDEMFPEWDGDVEDPAADNIIKVMFNDPGWKWTMDCWQVTGTHKVVKMEVSPVKNEVSPVKTEKTTVKSECVVKEGSSRPRKKACKGSSVSNEAPAAGSDGFGMTKEQIERAFKDISDAINDGFGTCHREIKLLGDRMGAVQKKVGITKKDDLPSDEPSVLILDKKVSTTSDLLLEEARRQTKKETAMVNLREKSEREMKLAPTQKTPFKGNSTAKQIIPNKKVGRGYDPFAPYDKKKSKELTEWVEQDPCPSRFYQVLRTSLEWLTDHQIDAFINLLRQRYQDHPQHFRSERMCFLDYIFSQQWRASYPDFKSDKGDTNGLGRKLPERALDAIWISIPKRHIVVWDSIIKHISPEERDELMEPFVTMVPYLLVECAVSDEQKVQYTLEPYTYERQTIGVQCRAGDCGPFTLKYIDCHALGMEFPKAFCKRNGKTIREKMAVDIFQELPMCHEWENQDNDENLETLGYVNRVRIG
uniref:Ubiquitin-like protease family profile domain-containing protein n=1 Tax=Brassica oleracea var. oleracea TaxID=109376 RepID=A0A0D3CHC0_BRAOL